MDLIKLLSRRNSILFFHIIKRCTPSVTTTTNPRFSTLSKSSNAFLKSYNPIVIPECGMKTRGKLELRCKHCYFERKDGQLYVNCSSYPRHKQQAMRIREKYRWILTYCSQSKYRPY